MRKFEAIKTTSIEDYKIVSKSIIANNDNVPYFACDRKEKK